MVEMKRILGKRGRTTIPYEFRRILDLKQNDVLTFAMSDLICMLLLLSWKIDSCISSLLLFLIVFLDWDYSIGKY